MALYALVNEAPHDEARFENALFFRLGVETDLDMVCDLIYTASTDNGRRSDAPCVFLVPETKVSDPEAWILLPGMGALLAGVVVS